MNKSSEIKFPKIGSLEKLLELPPTLAAPLGPSSIFLK